MMDKARKTTDKKLAQMERKVNKIYKEAYDDISKDWVKYMDSHAPKLQNAYDDLQNALASGDRAAIKEAKEHYEHTAMNITVNNKRFQGMVEDVSAKITHTNEVALAYVNDQIPEIYTVNYNAFKNEHIKGYTFSLVNEQAVKNLAKTDKTLLPTKKIDVPKDMRWNQKLINSQMTQGILQGESIPKMAKRLRNVTDMDRVASIRNARTMTTSAENKGRHDSYKKATNDGIILKRVWIATHDPPRVRDWHLALDGVEVDVDEPWENKYGQLMYPADPNGEPCNVYNCRCAMRVRVVGFKWNNSRVNHNNATVVPEPETEAKAKTIVRDYNTDFAKNYGNDYYDAMSDLVDKCENEDLKEVWQQYQTKIIANDPNYKGRAYASTNRIHVSKAVDSKGSAWEAPYAVTFHESGHAIDFITKDLADNTSGLKLMYSSAYKDGLFPATIREEVANMVKQKDIELKALFKAHKGDYEWLHNNGFISEYSWRSYQNYGHFFGGEPTYSKSMAYAAVQKEIKDIKAVEGGIAISDLSDMLEGATDARIQCGFGHGKSYWKKLLGVDEKLATEAFAEMTSASVTNAKSLETIKKYLPKSYSVYEDMLKDIASKGVTP